MSHRIQMSRRKGFRKPPEAVYVGRPSKWGNPFRAVRAGRRWHVVGPGLCGRCPSFSTENGAKEHAVTCYSVWARKSGIGIQAREQLAGKTLACWCALDQPCHADVLALLAVGEKGEAAK